MLPFCPLCDNSDRNSPATTNPTFCDEASDNINVNHGLDGHIQGGGSLFANPDNFHPALTCIETMTCPPGSPGRPCCDTICAASQKLAWTYDRAFDFVIFYTPSRLRVFVDELEVWHQCFGMWSPFLI